MSDFDDEHMEDQQRHYISKLKKNRHSNNT
jgi:hypothetical protein